ncbi:MAG: hypothetical protein ABEJ88_09970, partial [Halobacterium sp.]
MRVEVAGVEARGQAVDLRGEPVSAGEVAAAVRDPDDGRVECAAPRPGHERVGVLHRGVGVRVPAAVADAARSRGARSPRDAEITRLERELAAVDVADVDLAGARERVAETAADVSALEEQVARASGRVEARREAGKDAAAAEDALESATRALADAQTTHHAAREE